MAIFGARDASGASFFDGIYDVFCTCLNFCIKKCNFKNYQKITKKSISSWCLAVFGFRPLPQTSSCPGPFLTVFAMFYAHRALLINEPFFCLRFGRPQTKAAALATFYARLPPIGLKLRQRRMPCGSICPASDALCIAGFKTGWRLWPPTRASFPGAGGLPHAPWNKGKYISKCPSLGSSRFVLKSGLEVSWFPSVIL